MAFSYREPIDYRTLQEKRAAALVAATALEGDVDGALEKGSSALTQHPRSALIRYEMGLACNRVNRITEALLHYNEALSFDSHLITARYDRAELRLYQNDLKGAKADLNAIVNSGTSHWGVSLRLAEIAGLEKQEEAFSHHLMAAVERGFQLQKLGDLGAPWTDWIKDSHQSILIRRIVILYASGEVWDQLQR